MQRSAVPVVRERSIPEATVGRLPVYLRALVDLAEAGAGTVSSDELADAAGVNSAKVRKDLSHLGSYGTRGVGYDVAYLIHQIRRELGLTQHWAIVIVGHRQPRPGPRELRRVRRARVPRRGAGRRRSGQGGRADRRDSRCAHVDDLPALVDGARHRDRRDRDAGRRRAGGGRPARRGRRAVDPELRAGDDHGAAGGLRAQGRPGGGAADPRVLRAAEGHARGGEATGPGGGRRRREIERRATSRS